jgi:hypothetical protein
LIVSLLHVGLADDQRKVAIVAFGVTLFVHIPVDRPRAGHVLIGKVTKIKTHFHEFIAVNGGLPIGVEPFQDAAVFAEGMVDIPNEVGVVAVVPVVVGTAAVVGTKALIWPSGDFVATNNAGFFLCGCHKERVKGTVNFLMELQDNKFPKKR